MGRGKGKNPVKILAVRVRMTEAERAACDDLALRNGLTVSEYIRRTLDLTAEQRRVITAKLEDAQARKIAVEQEVSELTAELAALGVSTS